MSLHLALSVEGSNLKDQIVVVLEVVVTVIVVVVVTLVFFLQPFSQHCVCLRACVRSHLFLV